MLDLSVSKYGITYHDKGGGSNAVYSIKNRGVTESREIYAKTLSVIKHALGNEKKSVVEKVTSSLGNRNIKKVRLNEKEVSFVLENGKMIKVAVPQNGSEYSSISQIFNESIKTLTFTLHPINKVVDDVVKETKFKKILYLYSSGGGGHVSAKNALRDKRLPKLQENIEKALIDKFGTEKGKKIYEQHFPNYPAFVDYCKAKGLYEEKDVLHDFVGYMGRKGTESWDAAQKSGDVKKQERLAGMQGLTRYVFAPAVFLYTLLTLIRYKPEGVISTQAICNDSILSAIGVYNALFKPGERKNLNLNLYMTDMPTDLSDHFFSTIKKMFQRQKNRLVLHAPQPNDDFSWTVKIGLDKSHVVELKNMELPIRPAFVEAVKKFKKTPFDPTKIQIKINCLEEREMLEGVIGKDAIIGKAPDGVHFVDYELGAKDEAHYIMLGSQPTRSAIYDYIDQYVEMAKNNGGEPLHLFLFSGKYLQDKGAEDCLYKEISAYLKKNKDTLPENLKVVPLSYQNADQMVGLFARCHSVTRSGGGTCMELMVMDEVVNTIMQSSTNAEFDYKKPMRFVHSQLVKGRDAENSIPLWEKGNFYFMRDKFGAKVVTPKTLKDKIGEKEKSDATDNTPEAKASEVLKEKVKSLVNPLIVDHGNLNIAGVSQVA